MVKFEYKLSSTYGVSADRGPLFEKFLIEARGSGFQHSAAGNYRANFYNQEHLKKFIELVDKYNRDIDFTNRFNDILK